MEVEKKIIRVVHERSICNMQLPVIVVQRQRMLESLIQSICCDEIRSKGIEEVI